MMWANELIMGYEVTVDLSERIATLEILFSWVLLCLFFRLLFIVNRLA